MEEIRYLSIRKCFDKYTLFCTYIRNCWEDPLEEGMATHSHSCLENPNGQRSLASYTPWGCKESDTTEWLSTAHGIVIITTYDTCKCLATYFRGLLENYQGGMETFTVYCKQNDCFLRDCILKRDNKQPTKQLLGWGSILGIGLKESWSRITFYYQIES